MITDYKPGDRVRVSFEGVVYASGAGYIDVHISNSDRIVGLNPDEIELTKIAPDYKAQIEALEPGTAFVLTVNHLDIPYLRTNTGVVTQLGSKYTVEGIVALTGTVDNLRILK